MIFLFGVSLFVCCASVQAQEMEVPVQVQLALFAKIISFNRAMRPASESEFVLGILYQTAVRASSQVAEEAIAIASRMTFGGRNVRIVAMPIAAMSDVDAAIRKANLDALYVTPLRSPDIDMISRGSQRHKVLTLTGVPDFVEDGLAVGIALKGNRPQVVINLRASKAEGADFSSQLLSIAKIIP